MSSDDDPYVYPGTEVLRNKLDIRSEAGLDRAERRLVIDRIEEGVPQGKFDLPHLQAIHRHLFQDVYEWAGQIRTVEISKGGDQFQFRQYIHTGMTEIHRRIVDGNQFRGLNRKALATQMGRTIGDLNFVHPFREGNGRTQLQFAKQLAEKAGHRLDLTRLNGPAWIEASREAHDARYDAMARCFEEALTERVRQRDIPGRTGGRGRGGIEQ